MDSSTWNIRFSRKAARQVSQLPQRARKSMVALVADMRINGPVVNWPNYGKLGKTKHHCHIKKGSPTYVAVWEVMHKDIKLIEVVYAGTHEKAPY